MILKMDKLSSWRKIGETCDDAVGEAFDKVARLLAPISGDGSGKLANMATKTPLNFPADVNPQNYDFSFRGLKLLCSITYEIIPRAESRYSSFLPKSRCGRFGEKDPKSL